MNADTPEDIFPQGYFSVVLYLKRRAASGACKIMPGALIPRSGMLFFFLRRNPSTLLRSDALAELNLDFFTGSDSLFNLRKKLHRILCDKYDNR